MGGNWEFRPEDEGAFLAFLNRGMVSYFNARASSDGLDKIDRNLEAARVVEAYAATGQETPAMAALSESGDISKAMRHAVGRLSDFITDSPERWWRMADAAPVLMKAYLDMGKQAPAL